MARSYHGLGSLAQVCGDCDEAARQYQRALGITERLGDQAIAGSFHNLGSLAQVRGDYDEAARQYQRALDITERLGDPPGMARVYSQLGNLEKDRGGTATAAVAWHVKALMITLRLGTSQTQTNLRWLAEYRRELGNAPFAELLAQATGDTDLAETITSLSTKSTTTGPVRPYRESPVQP